MAFDAQSRMQKILQTMPAIRKRIFELHKLEGYSYKEIAESLNISEKSSGGVGESVNQNNRYRNQDNGNVIVLPQSLFEAGDNRKALVAPTSNGNRPLKFNSPQINNETNGDFPVIRAADVMLLYAEALNATLTVPNTDALAALNAVRLNAGITALNLSTVATKDDFRNAVYKERRLELALECDRWFDILRTGQMAAIYPLVPAIRTVYPVPQVEIDNITDKTGWQNTGYN